MIDDKNIHSKRCDVYDYVNGEIVQVGSIFSLSGYEEYYNKYRSDSIWYGFSEESCNETIQEEISQTKDKLKM